MNIDQIKTLVDRITVTVFGVKLAIAVSRDQLDQDNGRVYLQIVYVAHDTKSEALCQWKGRKWYLSEYMLADEVVKTAYLAVRTAVEHEVMEAFKVDGITVFNPHVPFDVLMDVSTKEVVRPLIAQ